MHQRCVCPKCGTTLRVKDRGYLNRPLPCPDCRTLLVLQAGADDQLIAALAEPAETESPSAVATAAPFTPRLKNRMTKVTVLSWLIALLLVAGAASIAIWPRQSTSQRNTPIAAKSDREATLPEENEESTGDVAWSEENDSLEVPTDSEQIVAEPTTLIPPEVPEEVAAEFPPADAAEVVADHIADTGSVPIALAPEPLPPVDFDVALAQPLKLFRQERAITRQELLDLVSEMLGAPIRYDVEALGSAARPLEQKILFELQDATVGDVLAKVLEKTDLDYDRERDGLRLRVKD